MSWQVSVPGLQYSVSIGGVSRRKMPGAAPSKSSIMLVVAHRLLWRGDFVGRFVALHLPPSVHQFCLAQSSLPDYAVALLRRRGIWLGGLVSGLGCVEQGENQAAGVRYRVGVEF